MKTIKFPDDGTLSAGGSGKISREGCVAYGDYAEIKFDDAGYFFHDNKTAFNLNLPTAYFEAGSAFRSGEALPKSQTVKLSFLSARTKEVHTYALEIAKSCR